MNNPRCCAGCSQLFLVGTLPGPYFCAKCHEELRARRTRHATRVDMVVNELRCCAACSRWFLADNRPGPYFCPKCHAVRMKNFDPQPWTPPVIGRLNPQCRVRRVGHEEGAFSNLLVVARRGDICTVHPIGFPEMRSEVHVGELVPGPGDGRG